MIKRTLYSWITADLNKHKVLVLIGPRQVGKTTLFQQLIEQCNQPAIFLNCDEPDIRQLLQTPTSTELKQLVGNAQMVVIDEAQRVKDIGITLKLLYDNCPDKQILVTGSSALELSNSINEPLTGRRYDYTLLPFSVEELLNHHGLLTEKRLLETRLLYGLYPDVVNNPADEQSILKSLSNSYLYKDVFAFQDVRKSETIEQLLQLLALQIGSEVSINELANTLKMNVQTVKRYIDLLEKAYIIYHLHSFSRNVRNELKKSTKIYFYDNGIRNALLNSFSVPTLRTDTGMLWENFMISERQKHNLYTMQEVKSYFWRTTQQQEIDYIEERNGVLYAYEFKWNTQRKVTPPLTFIRNYPNAQFIVVTPDNYIDFVIGKI